MLNNFDLNFFSSNSGIVTTSNGKLMGMSDGKSEAFMGVAFALPPIGSRRFMRPRSIKDVRWGGVRPVRKLGSMCMQRGGLFLSTPIVGSEDCLYLNVFRPRTVEEGDNVPVMVFIPGGAFSVGGSYWLNGQSDGSTLAYEENVIVVVLSYRLNIFGFLATEQLMHANGGTVGNLAMQDQQEGLRWVKREIENFGGDPERILLFGESAGGFSVYWHSVNEASRRERLFSSVIAQSATSDLSWFFQPKDQVFRLHRAYVKYLGCPWELEDQVACLQAMPAKKFLESWAGWSETILKKRNEESDLNYPLLLLVSGFGPVIDGHEDGLLDVPYKLIEKGEFHRVPMMAGITRNEGSVFSLIVPPVVYSQKEFLSPEHWVEIIDLIVGGKHAARELHALYPLQNLAGRLASLRWGTEIIRDFVFGCSTEETVRNWGRHAPAYLYLFSATMGWVGRLTGLGAMHSGDLFYLFKTFPPGSENFISTWDDHVASELGARWASMARSGNPNEPIKTVDWPGFAESGKILEFGFQAGEFPTSRLIDRETADKETWPEPAKCAFWYKQRPLPWISNF